MSDTSSPRPLALVTGASTGIGRELARQLAEREHDLIITADEAGVREAAVELDGMGVEAHPVQADLTTADGIATLLSAIDEAGRPLAIAALNAGVGKGGPFLENDLEDEQRVIDLNVTATVHLAKHVLRQMTARDEGRVLITSSVASTMPGPYQAVYNASKSFLQSFAEALQTELEDSAVTITSLMPGPTDTPFFERADMTDTHVAQNADDDPAKVASQGLEALFDGERTVLGGSLGSRAQGVVNKVLPDALKAKAHEKMAEPGSGDD